MSKTLVEKGLGLLLLLVVLLAFVPLLPGMPEGDLDPSWAFSMNRAVADGLVFGRDIVFSFGPYASVYTRLYHPATDTLIVAGSLYLALSYAFAATLVSGRSGRWGLAVLAIVLVFLMHSRDALLFSYPLLVGACCYRSVEEPVESGRKLVALAILFAPFGLLPLVKGSLLVLCALVGTLSLGLFLAHGRYRSAVVSLVTGAAAMLLFWMAAGQPADALVAWGLTGLSIISGYTQAMATSGPAWELGVYLLASLLLLVLLYMAPHARPANRIYIVLVFAGYLFLAFKGAFVRHDIHALLAGTGLLLATLFAAMLFSGRPSGGGPATARLLQGLLVISLVVCIGINRNYMELTWRSVAASGARSLADGWNGLSLRLQADGHLEAAYRQSLSELRSQADIPKLGGTTDIYSYYQSFLLASENAWNPRPVLQSYAAYMPALVEMNRNHLEGDHAPDNILFRVETIDGRLPSADDGGSWPALLALYRAQPGSRAFLHLQRVAGASVPDARVGARSRHAFLEEVPVPASDAPVYARMHISPTFAGKLVGIFYKPSPMYMRLTMQDDSTRLFRIVPGMMSSGAMVSPLIMTTEEFATIHRGGRLPSSNAVKSLAIGPAEHAWHWMPHYDLEFVTY